MNKKITFHSLTAIDAYLRAELQSQIIIVLNEYRSIASWSKENELIGHKYYESVQG